MVCWRRSGSPPPPEEWEEENDNYGDYLLSNEDITEMTTEEQSLMQEVATLDSQIQTKEKIVAFHKNHSWHR